LVGWDLVGRGGVDLPGRVTTLTSQVLAAAVVGRETEGGKGGEEGERLQYAPTMTSFRLISPDIVAMD